MFSMVPSWITDAGVLAAVFVSIISALAVTWRGAVRVRKHADTLIECHLIPIRADISAALTEMRPNHSTSLRDAIDRIENSQIDLSRRMLRCEKELILQASQNEKGRDGSIDRRKKL